MDFVEWKQTYLTGQLPWQNVFYLDFTAGSDLAAIYGVTSLHQPFYI